MQPRSLACDLGITQMRPERLPAGFKHLSIEYLEGGTPVAAVFPGYDLGRIFSHQSGCENYAQLISAVIEALSESGNSFLVGQLILRVNPGNNESFIQIEQGLCPMVSVRMPGVDMDICWPVEIGNSPNCSSTSTQALHHRTCMAVGNACCSL